MTTPKKQLRGFALMNPTRRAEIASKGGKACPANSRFFARDKAGATAAGIKGGATIADRAVEQQLRRLGLGAPAQVLDLGKVRKARTAAKAPKPAAADPFAALLAEDPFAAMLGGDDPFAGLADLPAPQAALH